MFNASAKYKSASMMTTELKTLKDTWYRRPGYRYDKLYLSTLGTRTDNKIASAQISYIISVLFPTVYGLGSVNQRYFYFARNHW